MYDPLFYIASQLIEIDIDEMTDVEKIIANVLVEQGYLIEDPRSYGGGEVRWTVYIMNRQ